MLQLGDITKINGYETPPVDVIIGGSPCQDLSIAGRREGLAGERSGLFMEQIRLVKESRDADRKRGRTGKDIRPRYMVWENVPGAFSSHKGEDFRVVLEETARVVEETAIIPRPAGAVFSNSGAIMGDGWSIAWRVHDAQFWGVPQRRRRIALVADFGDSSAPEILFERQGVCGDSAESGEQREGIAAGIKSGSDIAIAIRERAGCAGGGKGALIQIERSGTLKSNNDQVIVPAVFLYENHAQDSRVTGPLQVSPTASQKWGTGGNNVPLVMAGNLTKGESQARRIYGQDGTMPAITTRERAGQNQQSVLTCGIVRRLTPLECERLQGIPDGWTDIGDWTDNKGRKRKTSDAARYRAIGNSIAKPFWKWMLARLCSNYDYTPTMASLFDGIGMFPLIWQEINGEGTCLWASEIDPFCVAVTKKRFGE